jgi:hypothetical protein
MNVYYNLIKLIKKYRFKSYNELLNEINFR